MPQAACSMKDLSYFVTIIPLQPDSNILLSTKINTINLTSFQYNKTYTVLISTQIKADQLQSETVSALMFTTPMDEGHSITGTSRELYYIIILC